MRILTVLILAGLCQLTNAAEGNKKSHELNQWNPLNANYKIHSGGTAYSEPPTKTDSALSIAFRDEAAKQVFDQIGPDVEPVCESGEKGISGTREKGHLLLIHPSPRKP